MDDDEIIGCTTAGIECSDGPLLPTSSAIGDGDGLALVSYSKGASDTAQDTHKRPQQTLERKKQPKRRKGDNKAERSGEEHADGKLPQANTGGRSTRDVYIYGEDGRRAACSSIDFSQNSYSYNKAAMWVQRYAPNVITSFSALDYDSERVRLQVFTYFCVTKHRWRYTTWIPPIIHARFCLGCSDDKPRHKFIRSVHADYLLCWCVLQRAHNLQEPVVTWRDAYIDTLVDAFGILGTSHHMRKCLPIFCAHLVGTQNSSDFETLVAEKYKAKFDGIRQVYTKLKAKYVIVRTERKLLSICNACPNNVVKLACAAKLGYDSGLLLGPGPHPDPIHTYQVVRRKIFADEIKKRLDSTLKHHLCDERSLVDTPPHSGTGPSE